MVQRNTRPFPFYMTDRYRKRFLKTVYDRLLNKPDYDQYIYDVKLSCLNECIEFIEEEMNNPSMNRNKIFDYYYTCVLDLGEEIFKGR